MIDRAIARSSIQAHYRSACELTSALASVRARASQEAREHLITYSIPLSPVQDHPLSLARLVNYGLKCLLTQPAPRGAECDVFTAVMHAGRFAVMKQTNLRLSSLNVQAFPPAL